MSIDVSHIPALVDKVATPLVLDDYESRMLYFPQFCDVRPTSESGLYGTKGSVLEGIGDFKLREDLAEIEADIPGQGPTWYCKIHQYSRRFDISDRLRQELGTVGRMGDYIARQVAKWGERAAVQKDKRVADVLQKGTLTAGSLDLFDGSHPNETDPNPKFIYDGLPFFDTAHTITGVSGTTFSNHTASRALTEANLDTTLTTMTVTNAKDERNFEIQLDPDVLIVPRQLRRTALKILESDKAPGVSTNDINAMRGVLDPIVHPYLTDDTDAWWVGTRGFGLRVYDSGAPVIRTSYDHKTDSHIVSGQFYFGVVVTNWRGWYNCNKAAA